MVRITDKKIQISLDITQSLDRLSSKRIVRKRRKQWMNPVHDG